MTKKNIESMQSTSNEQRKIHLETMELCKELPQLSHHLNTQTYPLYTTESSQERVTSNGEQRSTLSLSFLMSSSITADRRRSSRMRAMSQMAYMEALSVARHPPSQVFSNYRKSHNKAIRMSPDVLFRRSSDDNFGEDVLVSCADDGYSSEKHETGVSGGSFMSSLGNFKNRISGGESTYTYCDNNIDTSSRSGNTYNQGNSILFSNGKKNKSSSVSINNESTSFWLYEKHKVSQSTLGTAAASTVILPVSFKTPLITPKTTSIEDNIEQKQMPIWKTEITPMQRFERAQAARLKKKENNIITVEAFQKLPLWHDIKAKLDALILRGASREAEKFGILFDVISTRYVIMKGAPHLVGHLIYEYIEQCQANKGLGKLKFVFVGITDNENCCAARDVFCLDDVIDGKYVGDLKRPFSAIDGVHMFAVMPPAHLSYYDSFLRLSEPGVKIQAMEMARLKEQRIKLEGEERKRIEKQAILPPMKIGPYRKSILSVE
eukprot:Tbor_TRINITY_DN3875_c0_g1::TRINITY_DN3875_c0_g1_i2::g.5726::m.5726